MFIVARCKWLLAALMVFVGIVSTSREAATVGQASIEGPEELYIKSGDDLALTCTFNVHATPSRAVLWYHGGTAVDPNSPRGGISLETEKLDEGIRSKLQVTEVSPRDSGNYTCVPSNAKPATVVVHITYGFTSPASSPATIDVVAGGELGIRGGTPGRRVLGPGNGAPRPYFDDVSPRNVTAIVGQTVVLNCRVKHLGDRMVSWMRKRDLHILTSSIHTYTGDGRFAIVHHEGTDDWHLQVDFVQSRDAGVYECQVNTEPKIMNAIYLNVEAAQASIWGPEDVFVKRGSTIALTCSINVHATPPGSVLWYHGAAVVDFDSPRGGISLETEKSEAGTTSKLLVTKASLADSGNYTCVPSNANPASVVVHVLNGEHPAAMQTGRAGGSPRPIAATTAVALGGFALGLYGLATHLGRNCR